MLSCILRIFYHNQINKLSEKRTDRSQIHTDPSRKDCVFHRYKCTMKKEHIKVSEPGIIKESKDNFPLPKSQELGSYAKSNTHNFPLLLKISSSDSQGGKKLLLRSKLKVEFNLFVL